MLNEDRIKTAINNALADLVEKDTYLLKMDANERSLTHRLAIYLEEEILEEEPGWNVDCEYNRDIEATETPYSKRLSLDGIPPPQDYISPYEDENATTVFPDIIVHKRGKSGDQNGNLIVIEVKKDTSSVGPGYDIKKKLPAYLAQLKYQYAFHILIPIKDCRGLSDGEIKKLLKAGVCNWITPIPRKLGTGLDCRE